MSRKINPYSPIGYKLMMNRQKIYKIVFFRGAPVVYNANETGVQP